MVQTKVLVVYTGGTIGMARRDPTNPASPLEPKPLEELVEYIPGLSKKKKAFYLSVGGGIEVDFHSFDEVIDSSDINPTHWLEMARIIQKHYEEFDGFVILHGTDTMAYTTSALSFMLQNLAKPVVVTGSQLPIESPRTDAIQNFVNSLYIAGYKVTGLPRIPEVVLCFWDKVLRGCRATKMSASGLDGFDSPNFPVLGKIGEHIMIDESLLNQVPKGTSELLVTEEIGGKAMEDVHVVDVSLHPAFQASQLDALLALPNVRGLVFRTYGVGNAQSDPKLLEALAKGIERPTGDDCVIVNVSQCPQGTVEMGLYAASSGLLEVGVISGLDLTQEAAFTKLYWTLATQVGGEITAQMQISQRGEQSLNLFDLRYGGSDVLAGDDRIWTGSVNPDRRFTRSRLSKAVVRLAGLEIDGIKEGDVFEVKIFMNKPRADEETSEEDPRCVAVVSDVWKDKKVTLLADITQKAREVIGDGAITLTLVPSADFRMSFTGLYLALFASAT